MSIVVEEKGISFKIILIGDSGTGKTSLIRKYIHGTFEQEYQVTVGVDFSSKTVFLGELPVQLQIWDTCGQDIYKSITNSFYRGAGAVFLVFALDDPSSFKKLQTWLSEFYEKGSTKALVFLIGTKCDLQHKVTDEEALEFMNKHSCSFFIETSSKLGERVDELFYKAAEIMHKYYQICPSFRDLVKPDRNTLLPNNIPNSRITLNSTILTSSQPHKKRKCCH